MTEGELLAFGVAAWAIAAALGSVLAGWRLGEFDGPVPHQVEVTAAICGAVLFPFYCFAALGVCARFVFELWRDRAR